MKKAVTILFVAILCILPLKVLAWEGDTGYEGGVSIEDPFKTGDYSYKEVCFITGKPIVLEGTLTIKRNEKQDTVVSTYKYTLDNADFNASLTRVITYSTKKEVKENGQIVESTEFDKKPVEVIRIDGETYVLDKYYFSRSKIKDPRPAVDFYAGEFWGTKEYKIGTTGSNGRIKIESTGKYYGYDQYWGNAQTQIVNYLISADISDGESEDHWGGTATVTTSTSFMKDHKFIKNEPYQISFSGGYIETQKRVSALEYDATMPIFDKDGKSTELTREYHDNISLNSHPKQLRLLVTALNHLRGYWDEDKIKMLFSLEVIPGTSGDFNPQKYVTRREYAAMLVNAARKVPEDPTLKKRKVRRGTRTSKVEISPFTDVYTWDSYYKYIKEAYDRKIFVGYGGGLFKPYEYISVADALTAMINALGLENLAPQNPVTTFRDNDEIPGYARSAVYVAQRIGLIKGDELGYINPRQRLTNEKAVEMIYNLIEYMGREIIKDYRDRMFSFY